MESKLDINIIKNLTLKGMIEWRNHILVRMQQRNIKITDIMECISSGEIIEYYENDYPFPNCLILGFTNFKSGLHVVCAEGQEKVWMITAYYPNTEEWLEDLKARRR